MRLDNLLAKRWSRNATLVQGVVALEIIEELGFGLDRMVAVMAEAGLPAPVFANHGDTFVVTPYGAAAQLRDSLTSRDDQGRHTTPEREQGGTGRQYARRTRHNARRTRQAWALDYMRTRGPLGIREYAAAQNVSTDTALRDLRDLVASGHVQAQGTTSDRRYVLRVDAGCWALAARTARCGKFVR